MQGAREKQERQHPLHQHIGKIDGAQHILHLAVQTEICACKIEQDNHQRQEQGGHHHTDGDRQADVAEIQVGQQCGQDKTGGGDF